MKIIEPKSCPYGFSTEELRVILGPRYMDFQRWMSGQTMMLCEGRSYDYDQNKYVPNECADTPHGPVVYEHDLRRFLDGRQPVD
jgi:hypothetical protein